MKKMSAKRKITLSVVLALGLAYLLTAAVSLGAAAEQNKTAKREWTERQRSRVAELEEAYAAGTPAKAEEQSFCSFDLARAGTDGARMNRLQYLATHNSYKTGLVPATRFLYHVPLFAVMGDKYDYCFDPLTDQLNKGIRSIELDPNYVRTDGGSAVETVHSDLLEACSSCVDFGLALKEIRMWMDYNPSALPIVVLLEPKGRKSYVPEAFDAYDGIIRKTFGERLIVPADFLGDDFATFDDFRRADAWPEIGAVRGKIMFLLHSKPYVNNYVRDYRDMREWSMFPALDFRLLKRRPELSKYACFAVSNSAAKDERIRDLISKGYMVRTRLDKYSVVSDKARERGVASGANILSTDYPPTDSGRYDYTCRINEDESITVRLRG